MGPKFLSQELVFYIQIQTSHDTYPLPVTEAPLGQYVVVHVPWCGQPMISSPRSLTGQCGARLRETSWNHSHIMSVHTELVDQH